MMLGARGVASGSFSATLYIFLSFFLSFCWSSVLLFYSFLFFYDLAIWCRVARCCYSFVFTFYSSIRYVYAARDRLSRSICTFIDPPRLTKESVSAREGEREKKKNEPLNNKRIQINRFYGSSSYV